MCAKFDAFTRFVTIFPLTDRTISRTPIKINVAVKGQINPNFENSALAL